MGPLHHTIREIDIDDLGRVFRTGEEIFTGEVPLPWRPEHIADIILEDMGLCFLAAVRKRITGIIIGKKTGPASAAAYWIGTVEKFRGSGLEEVLIERFLDEAKKMAIETVTFFTAPNDTYFKGLLEKFGFTDRGGMVVMERDL